MIPPPINQKELREKENYLPTCDNAMLIIISPTPFSLCFALLLCLPLAVFFTSTSTSTTPSAHPTVPLLRLSSSSLPQDDESLLRLASRVNSEPPPSNAPRRIAFMFLTTANTSLPLAPLWELFFHQNQNQNQTQSNDHLFNIYIHASSDSNSTSTSMPPVQGVFSNRVIHSKPTKRFSPTLIAAARRLLAHALLHDSANSMFALLSPSCIPLHSFNFTYTTLINASSDKSFIEILKDEPGAIDRWLARGGAEIMLPQVPFHSFRVGSQFFVLTRRHAKLVVKDTWLWSKFKLPCVRWDVCYPEEHYFPTLLNMRDPRGCVPATLTHVDWKGRSDGHPRTYKPSEVGAELILKLRRAIPRYGDADNHHDLDDCGGGGGNRTSNSSSRHQRYPFLFARKFSPESLHPLMKMANDVIFKE